MAWSSHPMLDTPYHLLKSSPMVCVHTPQGPSFIPMHSQSPQNNNADEGMGEERHCGSAPPPYQLPNTNATIFWGGMSTGMCEGIGANSAGGGNDLNGVSCNGLGVYGGVAATQSPAMAMEHSRVETAALEFATAPSSIYKNSSSHTPVTATPTSTPASHSSSPCPTPRLLAQLSSFSSVEDGSLEGSPMACGERCATADSDGGAFPLLRSKRTFESLVGSLGETLSCGGQFVQYGRGAMGPGDQIGASKERRVGETDSTTSSHVMGGVAGDMAMF
eukprot:GHVS01013333.1.p1 GENE.GHVS01013333.1~~GHVS01013333.1.p1  ORF type:complete len:276 (+),score=56.62 GHVS01013333.1:242-1069(+)